MNSENSKTYDSHLLSLKLADKINLKLSGRYCVELSNFSIYCTWKIIKYQIEKINL